MANLKCVFSRVQGDMTLVQNMPLKAVNSLYKARKVLRGDKSPLDLFEAKYRLSHYGAMKVVRKLTGKWIKERKATKESRYPSFL